MILSLSQVNPVHIIKSCFFKTYFNTNILIYV
jgi:hypothetical protein